MKKLLIAAIAGLLTLSLAACERRVEPAAGTSETPSASAPASTDAAAPAATTESAPSAEAAKPAEPAKSE